MRYAVVDTSVYTYTTRRNMKSQLLKWGNSHAVRIPKKVIEQAKLREGEVVEITCKGESIAIKKAQPKLTLEALVSEITPENLHKEQDWGKPVGNEIW